METATDPTWAHLQARAARVAELRTRCVTEHAEFERVTQHLDEPKLRLTLKQRRRGLLATGHRKIFGRLVSYRYRVHVRGLKMRIVALHNSIRKCGFDGCAIEVWKIAERLDCSTSQYRACMAELRDAGVFVVAPYFIAQRIVNRHDLRRGRRPRCYQRSQRANVVTFGMVGLQLLGVARSAERSSAPSCTALPEETSKFAVENLCSGRSTKTFRKPEGNDLENFEFSSGRAVQEGAELRSARPSPTSGDSLSATAHQNAAEARSRSFLRAWLADKEE